MDIALSIIAFVLSILGIIGCIVPLIPGVVFSYLGFLCAYFCSYSQIPTSMLWIWLAVCIAVSVIDYFLPGYLTRLTGGSRAGSIGATVGMIAGFIFGFGIFGIILGPFFGAVLGELLHDRNDTARAFKSGFGSFLAFIVGTGLKLIVAIWMLIQIWTDTYPVVKEWFATTF